MLISDIKGDTNVSKDSFYFAADSTYFNLYGKSLCLSLQKFAPWANIHVHLYNPLDEQLNWSRLHNLTVSYEFCPIDYEEIKTYYACVRFVRVGEIFSPNTRIMSIDADSIVVRPISEERFLQDTETSKVLWREKQQQSLASPVIFGLDDFRYRYSKKLKHCFANNEVKWFLDQNILDRMISAKEVETFTNRDWSNSKIGKHTLIWSAKGNRKNDDVFLDEVKKWAD